MSLVPAAHFLVDFGSKEAVSKVAEEVPDQAVAIAAEAAWAERVEEAFARGQDEGRKAAEAEANALREEQKTLSEQALADARRDWCEEQGPKLAQQITAAIGELQNIIAESVERVLAPFVGQAVRQEAVRQLRATVEDLIATNRGITLEISGPEDLLEVMRENLSGACVAVSYIASDAADVQIKAGASILETRIAEWLRHVSGGQAA